RATHHRNALPDAAWTFAGFGRRRQIEINIISDDQVQLAIAVVIQEGAAGAPVFAVASDACRFAYVCEGAVAVVVIQAILAVVGDEQVVEAVIIVIARAD